MRRRPTEEEERVDPSRPPRSLCLSGRRPECRGGGGERRGGGNQNNGGSRCLALCVRVCARDERNKGGGAETSDAFGSRTKRPMKQKKKGGEEERSNDMRGGATHEGMHEQRRTSALFGFAVRHSAHSAACRAAAAAAAAGEGRDRLFASRVGAGEVGGLATTRRHFGFPAGQLSGGRGEGQGKGEGEGEEPDDCSVPRRPVALGDRVGDVREGGAHQAEGLVAEGGHVVRRHALRLDLRQDLQPDGA